MTYCHRHNWHRERYETQRKDLAWNYLQFQALRPAIPCLVCPPHLHSNSQNSIYIRRRNSVDYKSYWDHTVHVLLSLNKEMVDVEEKSKFLTLNSLGPKGILTSLKKNFGLQCSKFTMTSLILIRLKIKWKKKNR